MITVAQAMVQCLEANDVSTLFGIPGATICPFFDALVDSKIKTIVTRHEQGAGHMASGYARATNKVGVCVATSGPGALNVLTAVATAYMDSIPLVVITGQVSSEVLGRDVFQEADITGAAEPFVKHSYLVKNKDEAQRIIYEAFHIANTGRKGAVLIDIPVDIQQELVEPYNNNSMSIRSYNPNLKGHMGQIKKLISAIESSKKPLICVGGGVISSQAETVLQEFSHKCGIPMVTTMMGISAVSPSDNLHIGMVGMYGHDVANQAVNESDLLILAGARVGDRAIMSPIGLSEHTTIAHLDIDPAEIGKNITTHIPIVGDIKDILTEVLSRVSPSDKSALCDKFKQPQLPADTALSQQNVVRTLMKKLPQNSIIISDVGKFQLYVAREYNLKNGRFFTSGGMGTMGYALPASIGASIGNADRPIICIAGDGGFQMSLPELSTLVEQNATVKIIVLNNSSLGLVKELQSKAYNNRYIAVDFSHNPDFVALAMAYGIKSSSVETLVDIETSVDEMLAYNGSYILEIKLI